MAAPAFVWGEIKMEYGEALEAIIRKIVREELAASAQGRADAPPTHTLTEREFCERVNISPDTAKRLRDKGKLKFIQAGRRILYTPEHVAEFLKANEKLRKGNTSRMRNR